jgi:hypothetical protein
MTEPMTVLEFLASAKDADLLLGAFPIAEPLTTWEWPEPDEGRPSEPLPTFPVDAFPGDLGKFVSALAIYQQISVDVPALGVLGALASVAGHHVIVVGQWSENSLNLYVAPLADSGEGKSPVMAVIVGPLQQLQTELRRAYEIAYGDRAEQYELAIKSRDHIMSELVKASGPKREAKQAALDAAKLEIKEHRPPPIPRLLAGDVTPEVLAKIMAGNGGHIAILSAEGGFFGNISGRYANGKPNVDLVLNALDVREPYVSDRVTRDSFEIARPSLSLVLCVQPIIIQESRASKALMDRGLLYRFLFAWPDSMAGRRDKAPASVPAWLSEEWYATVRNVYKTVLQREGEEPVVQMEENAPDAGKTFPPFTFDAEGQPKPPLTIVVWPQAEALHLAFRRELELQVDPDEGELRRIKGWVKKLEGMTYRIAALLHLAAGHSPGVPIDETTMSAAIRIAKWSVPHALAVLTGAGSPSDSAELTEHARKVMTWIKRKQPEEFTLRELHRGVEKQNWVNPKNGGGGSAAVAEALLVLLRAGWVASVRRCDKDGRAMPDGTFIPHSSLRGDR